MIGKTNAGGGGGKLFAIIAVTYPEGSICTCTNGTKTLKAKDTSGKALFNVPSAGTWTVTAKTTDGSKEKSVDVTIMDAGQVENIELYYALYIYKSGYQDEAVTGGLKGYAYGSSSSKSTRVSPSVNYGDTDITVANQAASNGTSASSLFAENAIDITNYNNLKINITNRSGNANTIGFGITKTKKDKFEYAAFLITDTTGEFSLDVSSIAGDYYVFVILSGQWGKSITFDKFVLE